MAVNTAGFQQVFDFGNPKIITAYAKEVISGGQFVYSSGASGVVSSGTNSFVSSDLTVAAGASGGNFLGVAISDAASGGIVPVLIEGVILATCNSNITNSYPVACDGNDSVLPLGSVAANLTSTQIIGRAFTTAASGGYCLVHIK